MPQLRILSGPKQDTVVALTAGGRLRLGRASASEIPLDDEGASREHAVIEVRADGVWIEDCDSINGTWVNGTQVYRQRLVPGDELLVGGTALRLEADTVGDDQWLVRCLLEIQRLLSGDEERVIERSLETLFLVLPATRLSLFEVDAAGRVHQGFTTTRSAGDPGQMSHGFARRVLERGQAMLLVVSDEEPGPVNRTLKMQEVHTALGVPVRLAGRPVGVLLCDNLDEPGRLDASHLRLVEFAAEALAHVFHRQELRRLADAEARAAAEFLAARRVQEQIFTKDPATLPGPFAWSVVYQPALELGGDFFDFHHGPAGTTWVVADVSGKGVPAALVVSLLKGLCKTLYPRNLAPRELILELDELLRGELPPHMFLTLMALQVDDAGAVTVAGVGHPPALVARRDGRIDELPATPGMLGLWPRALLERQLGQVRTVLAEGERVFVCTDGLLEAMDPQGRDYGPSRVKANLAATRGLSPAASLSQLLADVSAFAAGAPWADDLTMVVGSR